MSAPLRVGLAGAGWVAAYHLDAWSALYDRARVVAVADPDASAAAARAQRYGIPAVFASVEQMLSDVALDAIDIAAPREAHADICRRAAQRGIAILCQKPLAPTLAEAERLVTDVAGRVPLMVHENWRFRPHYRQVRAWIDEGLVGEVRSAVMVLLTSGLLPAENGDLPALVRQPMLAKLPRLLLMEVLIHHIDTLRFLLGPLSLEGAQLGRNCAAVVGEDRAALLLRTAAGGAVSVVGDFMVHGQPPQQMDRLDISGTLGTVMLRRNRLRLAGARDIEVRLDRAADYAASYRNAITHFIDGLDRGGRFETDAADNLETLRIVEAAYGSGG